jgi:hypothetical protein
MARREYVEAYERILPILTLAECRKIKKKEIDERVLAVEHSKEFRALKSYYEEQSVEYWANLELIGDGNDLATLDGRKKALRDLWRGTYGEENKSEDHSTSNQSN